MNTPTPHIEAQFGQIAKTVLMPGDPLRAKKMAEKFLTNYQLVSGVRNNFCYTGYYKDKQVSIMSSGMGNASMGIYSYELFSFYGVNNIIRVGTIGALDKNLHIGDVVVGKNIITDTNYDNLYKSKGECQLKSSSKLCSLAKQISKDNNINAVAGTFYSTDTFYATSTQNNHINSLKVLGIEMESGALYHNAKKLKQNALCLCTVSDEIYSGKQSTSEQRQNNFDKMFLLALEIATNL